MLNACGMVRQNGGLAFFDDVTAQPCPGHGWDIVDHDPAMVLTRPRHGDGRAMAGPWSGHGSAMAGGPMARTSPWARSPRGGLVMVVVRGI